MLTPARAQRVSELAGRLAGRRIVVVGDLLTDEYLYGKPARISREAPVLILRFTEREVKPGGAANATQNVRALGATAVPVGVVGADSAGRDVERLFAEVGIATDGLVVAPDRLTPVKTRIMAGGYESTRQQVVRLDREPEGQLAPVVEDALIRRLGEVGAGADAYLISDYGYGAASARVFEAVLDLARRDGVPVAVDSRYELARFRGATAATPNESEVEQALGIRINDNVKVLEKAGRELLERTRMRAVLITRGSRGMALFVKGAPTLHIPIYGSDEIADVTGAGDTVMATMALALGAGATFELAAHLANYAGGLVVMKRGTATVSAQELSAAVRRG